MDYVYTMITLSREVTGGKCQRYRTEPEREREDKEWTRAVDVSPSWHCQNICFDLPTGEGASQEWEVGGWMFLLESKGLPLVGVWGRNPKVFVALWRNLAKPTEPRRAFSLCTHNGVECHNTEKVILRK